MQENKKIRRRKRLRITKQFIAICLGLIVVVIVGILINLGIGHQATVKAEVRMKNEQARLNEQHQKEKAEQAFAALKPNGSPRSYIDDIRYFKALHDDRPVRIAAIGSSVTHGTGASDVFSTGWVPLLIKDLRKTDGFLSVEGTRLGFGGYTSGRLIEDGKINDMIKHQPDIVLFETCALNDHGQFVPLKQTLQNIETIVNQINKELPETKVILLSSNPKLDKGKNRLQLTLADYVEATKKLADEKGWDFVDIYGGFTSRGVDMKDYLSDANHPNDRGYKLWEEILYAEFKKEK